MKCAVCGKFISYADIENDLVSVDFTPDTEYTTEKTEFTHNKCLSKEATEASKS